MPIGKYFSGHGKVVMASMQRTYKSPTKAKRVFYATANKRKASLKEHTTELVRKGRLRMK